jgi:hypothetical protein
LKDRKPEMYRGACAPRQARFPLVKAHVTTHQGIHP